MTRTRATLTGFAAILLWSLLALLTVATKPVPPLQLSAVSFAIGGSLGLFWACWRGRLAGLRQVSWKVYAFGTAGLFGYHFLYFSALRLAPAAQAGLIAYLWPLLIVLLSGLLPGETLGARKILGAAIAFAGATLVLADTTEGFSSAHTFGYALALGCAFTWSTYSVASRHFAHVPTDSIAVFCVLSAILSAITHVGLEETVWPDLMQGWIAMITLGLGPVGLAFYLWDTGMKKGDIQFLGVASYLAPLLSTLLLVVAGYAHARWALLFAALLISGGAFVATRRRV